MTRILFVDDDPFMLSAMRRMLRKWRPDWEVEFAESGNAALKKFSVASFDVVVSDMRMPGMTGLELLTQLRDLFPDAMRIVLSGQADVDPGDHRDVAHAWLPKPCEPELLEATIDQRFPCESSMP